MRLPAVAIAQLALLIFTSGAQAAEPMVVGAPLESRSLVPHVEFFLDEGRSLTLAQVRSEVGSNRFKQLKASSLNLGYTPAAIWIRFQLHNPSSEPSNVLLEVGHAQLDDVTLYYPNPLGGYESLRQGDLVPIEDRPLALNRFVFPIAVPAEQIDSYYLRVVSTSSISIPLQVSTAKAYSAISARQILLQGLFYGAILALAAYNLFLFLSVRETAYLWYALASGLFCLYFAQLDGLTHGWWQPDSDWQRYCVFVFAWLASISSIQFARAYLGTRDGAPTLDAIARSYVVFYLCALVSVPFLANASLDVISALAGTSIILTPIIAVVRLRAGFLPAAPYLLASVPFLIFAFYVSFAALGIVSDFVDAAARFKLAMLGERVLMSLALASRLKVLGDETREAQLQVRVEMSERHQVENRLRESEERLLQSQKMEAIGSLAGGIAHDFNNMLTVIRGSSELILKDNNNSAETKELAGSVVEAADQAAGLTRQLLTFSRRDLNQPKVLDVNSLVNGLERMLRRLIGEHISLTVSRSEDLAYVKADPGHLEQVVLNLAVNARDAMPMGGLLAIEVTVVEIEAPEVAGEEGAAAGAYVCLSVADTGTGIPKDIQARIFEPFFTTKEIGQGTGLGLATVYGIVKQSGGFLRLESEEGQGTTFNVLLPHCTGELDEQAAPDEDVADQSLLAGRETILLVEDEERILELVLGRLESLGYQVLSAGDGQQALSLVQQLEGDIDLLISDVVMPKLGGPELAKQLFKIYPRMKLILMSGYATWPGSSDQELPENATYLQKPFSLTTLPSIVRKVLDG